MQWAEKRLDRRLSRLNRSWVKQPQHQSAKQRERDAKEPSSGAAGAKHLFALPPNQHLRHRFIDGKRGVVKVHCVLRGL